MLKFSSRRLLEISVVASLVATLPLAARAADKKKAKTDASPAATATAAASDAAGPSDMKAGPAKAAAAPVDDAKMPDVVATVNGTAIKKGDLQNAVESVKAQMQMVGTQVPADRKDEMYRGLLDDLIATELLAQEAKTRAIPVSDKDVDDFVSGFKDRFPSEQVFQNALKEQGITEVQLRSDVRKQLGIKKLLEKEVMSKVTVSDKDAKKFYDENPDKFQEPEQVHAAHVLVTVDKGADDKTKAEKKKEATQVLADAKAGKDFAQLAKDHSGDPGSKDKGGDLGFFPRGEMVKAFEDAAFALKNPGDLSDVVETPYGFHVIKLVERKPSHVVPFDDVKKDIGDFMKEKKAGELAKGYVDGLRKKAQVKIFI
ncbi:MAG TPA: peptidylprolyl isomerase [bacterium]|nr:peptidylprolyl isomerase [bacterium]